MRDNKVFFFKVGGDQGFLIDVQMGNGISGDGVLGLGEREGVLNFVFYVFFGIFFKNVSFMRVGVFLFGFGYYCIFSFQEIIENIIGVYLVII